jgi:hypothetical protein
MRDREFLEDPHYYDAEKLSDDAAQWRHDMEADVSYKYMLLANLTGVPKMKLRRHIDALETRLAFQGANPKEVPFDELKEHVQADHGEGSIMAKYRERIKNRATGIRAYCVQCQGGEVAAVRECAAITCPLYPFRMGKDPFRGYEIPNPTLDDTDEDEALLDSDDSGDDSDAS